MDINLGFIFDFFDWVADIWNTGIYDFFTEFVEWFVIKLATLYIEMKIGAVQFAWDVAQGVMAELNISAAIEEAFGYLPSDTRAALTFFRVPESVNVLVSGLLTRFVLRFLPGF